MESQTRPVGVSGFRDGNAPVPYADFFEGPVMARKPGAQGAAADPHRQLAHLVQRNVLALFDQSDEQSLNAHKGRTPGDCPGGVGSIRRFSLSRSTGSRSMPQPRTVPLPGVFRLGSTASGRGLMVWANSAGVSQPRLECGR